VKYANPYSFEDLQNPLNCLILIHMHRPHCFIPASSLLIILTISISCGSGGSSGSTNSASTNNGDEENTSPPELQAADFDGFWIGRLQGINPDCPSSGTPLFFDVEISFRDALPRSEGSDLFDYTVEHLETEVEIQIDCPGDVFFATLYENGEDPTVLWDRSTGLLSIRYFDNDLWRNRTSGWNTLWANAYLGLDLFLNESGDLEILFGEMILSNNFEGLHGQAELFGDLTRF
jgi:hypothetical protein